MLLLPGRQCKQDCGYLRGNLEFFNSDACYRKLRLQSWFGPQDVLYDSPL